MSNFQLLCDLQLNDSLIAPWSVLFRYHYPPQDVQYGIEPHMDIWHKSLGPQLVAQFGEPGINSWARWQVRITDNNVIAMFREHDDAMLTVVRFHRLSYAEAIAGGLDAKSA